MVDDQYVWFFWASAFLVPWILIYLWAPSQARMLKASELSGVALVGSPLEELAFGFAFGMYGSGLYEHFTWKKGEIHVRAFA